MKAWLVEDWCTPEQMRWADLPLPEPGLGQVRVRVDIFNAVAAMLHTGIGVGILPTFMEPAHPGLVAVSEVRASVRMGASAGFTLA